MWLADFLPFHWPRARILIYGYESAIMGTESVQDLQDISRVFKTNLISVRQHQSVSNLPAQVAIVRRGFLTMTSVAQQVRSFDLCSSQLGRVGCEASLSLHV